MLARAGLLLLLLVLPYPSLALSIVEAVDGDLSDLAASPTAASFDPGANDVSGSAGGGDLDLLAFTIAPGEQLDGILLTSYSGFATSFLGLAAGGIWPTGFVLGIDPTALLGWGHIGFVQVGADFLPLLPQGAGVQGFGIPLGAGTYTLLVQETGGSESYGLRFLVSAVPEPGSLLAIGLAGLAARAARRRSRATPA